MEKLITHKTGNKIILRDWLDADFDTFRNWNQVGQKWMELDGSYYEKSQESCDKQLQRVIDQVKTHSFPNPRNRLVIADIETNLLLGTVGCYWESIETNWLCAGIAIYDPEFWGKGIGYEALGLWTEFLFENYEKIVRLDLRTWSGNLGLIGLAKKLGFTQEACFRKARIVNGEYYDSLGFGILREEFKRKYPIGFIKANDL